MAPDRKAKPAAPAPISTHPLFPVIVALWFAALLGIGTMVLPQTMFDQLGVATGLGALGIKFRLGLGLAAGLVGALVGVLVARKVASGTSAGQRRMASNAIHRTDVPTRKPISAMDELGSERLDDPIDDAEREYRRPAAAEPLAGRRRPLTVTDDISPSDFTHDVPLPGGQSTLDLIGAEPMPDELPDEAPLELGHFDQEEHDIVADLSQPAEPANARSSLFGADPFDQADADTPPLPDRLPAPSAGDGIFRAPQAAPATGETMHASAPFAAPRRVQEPVPPFGMPSGVAEPAPSTAPVARQLHSEPAPASAGAPFAPPMPMAPQAAKPRPDDPNVVPRGGAAASGEPSWPDYTAADGLRVADELAALDTVALVERFARALHKASADTAIDAEAANAAPAEAVAQPHDPATMEPVSATPARFAMPSAPVTTATPAHPAACPEPHRAASPDLSAEAPLPTALAPLQFDEHDDGDEHDQPFSLPLAGLARPVAAAGEPAQPHPAPTSPPFSMPEPEDDTDSGFDPEEHDRFGSLLAMRTGLGASREFVRVDDEADSDGSVEPAVVFPGTAPQGGAMPAADGPSRDPGGHPPFARPQAAPRPAALPVDRSAAEAALRDALARLQQMSGAA